MMTRSVEFLVKKNWDSVHKYFLYMDENTVVCKCVFQQQSYSVLSVSEPNQ